MKKLRFVLLVAAIAIVSGCAVVGTGNNPIPECWPGDCR
jgi:hypothetical protein